MADYRKPLPTPTPDTKPFWDGLKEHVIRMKQCRQCSKYHHYPRSICPYCGSTNLEWKTVSGKGKIYSYTINYRPPPGWENEDPPIVAMVELDEGPRVMTNIVGLAADPAQVKIGSTVEPVFDDVTPQITLLKYRVAPAPARGGGRRA